MERPLVLVVEDETLISLMLQDGLEFAGFDVQTASNGEDALRMLETFTYAALATDLNLGRNSKLSGWDVARRAREIAPGLAVIYTSGGFAASDWAVQRVPNSVMVSKPFGTEQVVTAISQLLNIGSASAA